MAIDTATVTRYICERCDHKWVPRDPLASNPSDPKVCPKCKSPYWNRPRRSETAKAGKKGKTSKRR